jgi:hypothetical protein
MVLRGSSGRVGAVYFNALPHHIHTALILISEKEKSMVKQKKEVQEEVEKVMSEPIPVSEEKLFEMMAELDKAKEGVVERLLAERAALDMRLLRLGYKPTHTRQAASGVPAVRTPTTKPCKICGELGHDARKHRWDKKAPQPGDTS